MTRILVVDDHPIVRLGIRQMVESEPDLEISAEAETAADAQAIVSRGGIDLAIVDLSLGGGTGLDLIRALRASAPEIPVLVLSMHDEALYAERTLRAGARGYIMKQQAIDGLVSAIRRVLSGEIHVSDAIAQGVLQRLEGAPPRGELGPLTDRELEVFDLIGRGLGTAAIADELQVSVKTIETYRSNIKTKLHLKDGAELIRFATSWTERL